MKGINYIQFNKIDSATMAFSRSAGLQFNPNSTDAMNFLRLYPIAPLGMTYR